MKLNWSGKGKMDVGAKKQEIDDGQMGVPEANAASKSGKGRSI